MKQEIAHRYILFAGEHHSSSGGCADIRSRHKTLEEAVAEGERIKGMKANYIGVDIDPSDPDANEPDYSDEIEWWNVLDVVTGKQVAGKKTWRQMNDRFLGYSEN